MAKNPLTQKDVTDYLSANNLKFDPQGISTALAKYNGTIGNPADQYSINDVGAAFGYSPEQSRAWMNGGATATNTQPQAKPQGLLAQSTQTTAPAAQAVQPVSAPQIQAAPSAVQAQAQQITVDPTKTSQGLYEQYSAKDSLAKQLAETASMERANSRGLLNSSMAVGEAQKARDVVDMTSAQADSNIYATAKNISAQLKNQSDIASMQESGANSRLWQQLAMQKDLAQLDANTRLEVTNKTLANQMDMTRLDAATRTNIAKLDTDSRERMAAASLSSNEAIAKMNVSTSERGQFQSAVTQAMGNYANAINRIDLDTNLDPAGKAAARLSAETLMHNSMTAAAAVAGVEGISELWAA